MFLNILELQPLYTSLLATISFGIIFNIPKRTLISAGIIGMIGWGIYTYLITVSNYEMIFATFLAALFVAFFSQILAKFHKIPVTVLSVSGIIPLVPGGIAYDSMRNFIENDYATAIMLATETMLISGAIAFGLIFSGIISQTIKRKGQSHVKNS